MSNVIDFATRKEIVIGEIAQPGPPREPYSIYVWPHETGFKWELLTDITDNPNVDQPDPDDVAADLAAIAFQLRPPPRTFLERLKALIFGDEE